MATSEFDGMQPNARYGKWRETLIVGLVALVGGCAAAPKQEAQGPVFYPPPPETPRLQFLTSYSEARDIRKDKGAVFSFIVGKTESKESLVKPYGVTAFDGKIYVCDSVLNAVAILDLVKQDFEYWIPSGAGQFRGLINLSIDQDGTRYVADSRRGQVLIYGPDGTYRGALGEMSEMKPTDVVIGAERLFVADLKEHQVRVYRKADRSLLFAIPRDPKDEAARLYSPVNLALDLQERLYVSDIGANRVQQYDAEGRFLRTFGRHGDALAEFARPKGVAVDREGRLYAVDAAAQVIQIFDDEGRLLLFFGEPGGSRASLCLPAKVAISYDHLELFQKYAAPDFQLEYVVLVTNQYGERKVSVYGFGHKK